MKFPDSLLAAILGGLAFAATTPGLAQNPIAIDPIIVGPPFPITIINPLTASGTFRTSDGDRGNYTETSSFSGVTTTTTFVYALLSSTETSTDTTVTTNNLDGSKIVTFSHLAFGVAVPFTSTTTYAANPTTIKATPLTFSKGTSGAVGTGTYTAEDGTSGTLVSLLTHGDQEIITSNEYTSAAGVTTRELRIENESGLSSIIRTLTTDSANTLTVTALTRFPGRHHNG